LGQCQLQQLQCAIRQRSSHDSPLLLLLLLSVVAVHADNTHSHIPGLNAGLGTRQQGFSPHGLLRVQAADEAPGQLWWWELLCRSCKPCLLLLLLVPCELPG
jgi:hypothetical protein